MQVTNVLFISGSIGLGHVTRDLGIARALREQAPQVAIAWLAGDAARDVIAQAGERLLPESARYTAGNAMVEGSSSNFALNLANPAVLIRKRSVRRRFRGFVRDIKTNVAVFKEITSRARFDLVIGDETFELALAIANNPRLKTAPFVLITDWVGADAMTRSPLERALVYWANRGWVKLLRGVPRICDAVLFVGEEEDVPDRTFGWRLPNRRALARGSVQFLGYVVPFDPAELTDRDAVRARLGYGREPLVVCAVGGTSVGAPLLRLCVEAYPLVRERVPGVRFVVVCGPRLPATQVSAPEGVEILGYVPRLYEYFAACDLAVVQGGGSSTIELTALRRPFLYFPLEKHFEQQLLVTARLQRQGAGVKLDYIRSTPATLAAAVVEHLGKEVRSAPINIDGAAKAAAILAAYLLRG